MNAPIASFKRAFSLKKLACLLAMLLALGGCGGEENDNGETRDADVHDAGDAGDSGPAEEDTGDDADASEEQCQEDGTDSDDDGLTDCEEEALGTDADNADTDGDGLRDGDEVQQNTDPREADTDGDGLDDGTEVDLGLNPLAADSFGDGTLDSERWFVTLCGEEDPAALDFHENSGPGNWRLALASDFGNYTELTIDGADAANQHAAAVFSHANLDVAGSLLSFSKDSAVSSPGDQQQEYSQALSSVGSVLQSSLGGEFQTHDHHRASLGSFAIDVQTPMSAEAVRDEVLIALAPFEEADISDLPAASGDQSSSFRVHIGVVIRESESGDDHVLTLVAVAPNDSFEDEYPVQFAMGDLTNTTHLAEAGAGDTTGCELFRRQRPQQADYYWVVDHTNSMADDVARVKALAAEFTSALETSGIDARFSATGMEQDNKGRLDPAVGWQRDAQTFIDHVGDIAGTGGTEAYGLYAAREGIGYMKSIYGTPSEEEETRPNARLVTIFVTDKEAQSFVDSPLETSGGQQLLGNFESFFASHTIAYGFLGDGEDCGEAESKSYESVITETSGSWASLCTADVASAFGDIIRTNQTTRYALPDTPISGSIRAFAHGAELARDRDNGFDYSPSQNAVSFFGDARPTSADQANPPPDFAVVIYETYE